MIQISESLREGITEEMIEKSQRLSNQIVAEPAGLEGKKKEINEEIWAAKQGYDKAVGLRMNKEAQEMVTALEKKKKKLAALEYERSHPREEARKEIERINAPLIEESLFLIDQFLDRLPGKRVLRVIKQLMTNDPLIMGMIKVTQTNRVAIAKVRELLLNSKKKIQKMKYSPISEILLFIEGVEGEVNKVDLKQCDEVQMRDSEYHDEMVLMEEKKSPSFSPQYYKAAQRGFLEDEFDNLKQKVKRVLG
jgi:hypothetical protein